MPAKIFNIAHAGFSGSYPENTLIAFQKAAEIGADMVELDVTASQDGVIVAIHDETLERTTDGSGWVRDHTLAELKKLDAGSRFAPEFAGERIPTLAEIFGHLKDTRLKYAIEIKKLAPGVDAKEVVETIIRVIDDHDMRSRSILIGFQADYLALAKQIDSTVTTGYNPGYYEGKTGWQIVQEARRINADLIIPRHDWLTALFVDEMHAHGLPLWPWTVDDEGDMRRVLATGADGVITNYPDRLKVILQRR